jgi:hypothetical protein
MSIEEYWLESFMYQEECEATHLIPYATCQRQ